MNRQTGIIRLPAILCQGTESRRRHRDAECVARRYKALLRVARSLYTFEQNARIAAPGGPRARNT